MYEKKMHFHLKEMKISLEDCQNSTHLFIVTIRCISFLLIGHTIGGGDEAYPCYVISIRIGFSRFSIWFILLEL